MEMVDNGYYRLTWRRIMEHGREDDTSDDRCGEACPYQILHRVDAMEDTEQP